MTLALDPALDLEHLPSVLEWTARAYEAGATDREIADAFLSSDRPISYIRALTHLMRTPNFDSEEAIALLRKTVIHADNYLIRALAFVTMIHLGGRDSMLSGQKNNKTNHSSLVDLESHLREIQLSTQSGMLRLEAEYRIYHAMAVISLTLNQTDEIERFTSRLMILAEMIGNTEVIVRTQSFCASAFVDSRKYGLSVSLSREQRAADYSLGSQASFESIVSSMANAFLNLGNIGRAELHLELGKTRYPESTALIGYSQWLRSQMGTLPLDTEIYPKWHKVQRFGWQIEAFLELARAMALGPHQASRIAAHYRKIVDITKAGLDTRLTADSNTERWLRARARLGLREYVLALQEAAAAQPMEEDEFLYRAWFNALQIELGMSTVSHLNSPMHDLEDQAREIFQSVRRVDGGDAEGLAKLLMRWLPSAAAYLGIMPKGIAECRMAVENVLRIRRRSQWRETIIPPLLALHLTLEALGKTHQMKFNANTSFQVRPLKQPYAESEVWGPTVAPVAIALGLLRAGHNATLQEWLSITDIAPQVQGAMGVVTTRINDVFAATAQGKLGFAELLQELDGLSV